MHLLDILVYPDPALKRKSLPVEKFGEEVESLLNDMVGTLREAEGVGLAAPQVGVNVRAVVVIIPPSKEREEIFYELINPEIVSSGGFQVGEEGCLSVPGFFANVRRKQHIKLSAFDRTGNRLIIEAEGMLSRVLQHEIDHLDGILFFERLSRLKRNILLKRINERFVSS